MKLVKLGICILSLLTLSAILIGAANAFGYNSPPLGQLTVVDGTQSYFTSTLYFKYGYNVFQGTFLGWCVDRSATMTRGVPHAVYGYWSPSSPVLTNINWVAINYILNHKQGSMMDIQEAIWYFSSNYSPISSNAQAMVNAALANPNYNPCTGKVRAVILIPIDPTNAQATIFEDPYCCCCPFG